MIATGLEWQPTNELELGLDLAWTEAEAALAPFDFEVPGTLLNPNQSYDFTLTHTNSDLDLSRLELALRLRYQATAQLAVTGGYRYLDFQDDTPYLYDTSGEVSFYSLGLAYSF